MIIVDICVGERRRKKEEGRGETEEGGEKENRGNSRGKQDRPWPPSPARRLSFRAE